MWGRVAIRKPSWRKGHLLEQLRGVKLTRQRMGGRMGFLLEKRQFMEEAWEMPTAKLSGGSRVGAQ